MTRVSFNYCMELLKNLRILTIGIVIALGATCLTLLVAHSVTTLQEGSAGGNSGSHVAKRSYRDYAGMTIVASLKQNKLT